MLAPLLAASTAAYAVTVLLLKRSILTEKIARRGQHITREYGIDPFRLARVAEVMVRNIDTLAADLPVIDAIAVLQEGRHRIYPVVDAAGRPVGLVSCAHALQWTIEGNYEGERLEDRMSSAKMAVVHPDEITARAIELMLAGDYGRIPVTDRATGVLVGLVTRKDLLQVWAAVARSEGERQAFIRRRTTPA